jgi:predicted transcriptional regulator YheO
MTTPTEQEIRDMEERITEIINNSERTVNDDLNAFRAKMLRDEAEERAFNERADQFKKQLDREVLTLTIFSVASLGIAVIGLAIPAVKYFRYRNR